MSGRSAGPEPLSNQSRNNDTADVVESRMSRRGVVRAAGTPEQMPAALTAFLARHLAQIGRGAHAQA